MDTKCVVFVCNKPYFDKFLNTCYQLLTLGCYRGEICLVIGDDLYNDSLLQHKLIVDNNIIIKHFPEIYFPYDVLKVYETVTTWNNTNQKKRFTLHKFHLFNTYFKRWNYIFYIDCGMTIFSDITPILLATKKDTLLAHSDAFPSYEWKLDNQFDMTIEPYASKLRTTFNMKIDYPQSTILLYDTSIIEAYTYEELYRLMLEYPIAKVNEQSIMALYFTSIKPVWKQIQTHNETTNFYDHSWRQKDKQYIMVKMH